MLTTIAPAEETSHAHIGHWGTSRLHPEYNALERNRDSKRNVAELGVERVRKTKHQALGRDLYTAGWPFTPREYRLIQVLAGLNFLMFFWGHSLPMEIFAFVAPSILMALTLRAMKNRKLAEFEREFPEFLNAVEHLVKIGKESAVALIQAAKTLPESSVMHRELTLFQARLHHGVPRAQAVAAIGEAIDHQQMQLFRQSLILQLDSGGTISPQLQRISHNVRRDRQFRRGAGAAIGMQRSSMWLILGVLFVVLFYAVSTVPEVFLGSLETEIGKLIFESGLVLLGSGFLWMSWLGDIKLAP